MREYGFSLTRILPYKDRIYGFLLTVFSHIRTLSEEVRENLYSGIFYTMNDSLKYFKGFINFKSSTLITQFFPFLHLAPKEPASNDSVNNTLSLEPLDENKKTKMLKSFVKTVLNKRTSLHSINFNSV